MSMNKTHTQSLGRLRENFLTMLFSESFTIERWLVSDFRNVKNGAHWLRFGEDMPGRTPKFEWVEVR